MTVEGPREDERKAKIQGIIPGQVIAWWSGPTPYGTMQELVGFIFTRLSYEELPVSGQQLMGRVLWALYLCRVTYGQVLQSKDVPAEVKEVVDQLMELVVSLMPEGLGLCSDQILGLVTVVDRSRGDGKAVWHIP